MYFYIVPIIKLLKMVTLWIVEPDLKISQYTAQI